MYELTDFSLSARSLARSLYSRAPVLAGPRRICRLCNEDFELALLEASRPAAPTGGATGGAAGTGTGSAPNTSTRTWYRTAGPAEALRYVLSGVLDAAASTDGDTAAFNVDAATEILLGGCDLTATRARAVAERAIATAAAIAAARGDEGGVGGFPPVAPRLLALDWRIGLVTASHLGGELAQPFVTLQLTVTESPDAAPRSHCVEMSLAQFRAFRKAISDASFAA